MGPSIYIKPPFPITFAIIAAAFLVSQVGAAPAFTVNPSIHPNPNKSVPPGGTRIF